MTRMALALSLALGATACSSGAATISTATTTGTGAGTGTGTGTMGSGGAGGQPPIGGDRPVEVQVPANAMPGVQMPLLILLHGYSVDGVVEELYFQIGTLGDARGFYFAAPNGTVDTSGNYFWNATDACCDYDGSTVDDSAYLSSVITEIEARYPIDPKQVYLVGHSNGGFMSYR